VQSTEEQQNHAQIGIQKVDDIEAHIQQEISLPQTTSLSLFQLYYVTTPEIQPNSKLANASYVEWKPPVACLEATTFKNDLSRSSAVTAGLNLSEYWNLIGENNTSAATVMKLVTCSERLCWCCPWHQQQTQQQQRVTSRYRSIDTRQTGFSCITMDSNILNCYTIISSSPRSSLIIPQ